MNSAVLHDRKSTLTPEAACLLATLRQSDLASPNPSLEPPDWNQLLALAKSHGVLPLFYKRFPGQLPPLYAKHYRESWANSHSLSREFEAILGLFARGGVEILPLKGPVLAQLLYGDVALRPSDDLDLLVRPEDFPRAEALLIEAGFEPTGFADDYHRDFHRNGVFVELHFGIASPSAPQFDLSGAWKRARSVDFRGHSVRFFSPVDLVLYLALHGLKHRFARLIWVVDVAYAVRALDRSEASRLLEQASARQLRNILLTSCEIARLTFSIELPPAIAQALRSQPEIAARSAAIADAILESIGDPTTSVDSAVYYLQLADNRGRRWKQRLQFFIPTHQDYEWLAQHRIHRRCAPLVRPFRLLAKYGPAPAFRTLFARYIKIRKKPGRSR